MDSLDNYIGGAAVTPASGKYLDNVEPATGKAYCRVADSDAQDIDQAVESAQAAFPRWSGLPAAERSRLLLAVADGLAARFDELAAAESRDAGKPVALTRTVDIPRAIANFRFFATAILHTRSDVHFTDGIALNYTQRSPRGVAGVISPWNLPLYLLSWKIAPALATGNTVVAKPSELTPWTAWCLGTVAGEAGLPPGVLNIVLGTGARAGAPLTAHPRVPTISFTGGTATGGAIASVTAPTFKKVALEMGGKNPNVIFADADLDRVVETSLRSSFANQGQICLCGSRILVERSLYAPFLERFVEAAQDLRSGDPADADTQQGAVVSRAHYDKVLSYITLAREEGGDVLCGGGPPDDLPARCRDGYFIRPTVITGLPAGCRVNQEEIFGPVVTVMPFDDENEAVAAANGTRYGLSATVWTRDVERAHRVAGRLEAGTVWVNCWLVRDLRVPFGGVKDSGIGREGGDEALRFYTEPKNVCIHLEPGAEQ
jgi:aminomuconate-semialdehyde/2-hydroxymuconate-6-semialdehyde dehydrogenase